MTATGTFTICMTEGGGCRIGRCEPAAPEWITVETGDDWSAEKVAAQLAVTLKQNGYTGGAVTLAIPSGWCLCAGVSTDGLPRKGTRSALIYRLEEKLPIAAEETVADFVASNGRALGVCVESAKLLPLVESLEQHGVHIDLICPLALLALQHKIDSGSDTDLDTVVWAHEQQLELFSIQDQKPATWNVLNDADGDNLPVHLAMQSLHQTRPLRLIAGGVDKTTQDRLEAITGIEFVAQDDASILDAAVVGADMIITGKRTPWINLRRGVLAAADTLRQIRRPLTAVVVAMVIFLVCASAAMLWRANHYRRVALKHETQQTELYRDLFPNRSVPVNIKSRLSSEHRRLSGIHGGDAALPQQTPVLLMLRDALLSLPVKGQYRIFELQIDEGKLFLEGEVQSHGQAEAIAAVLNQQEHFQVDPPRTEKRADQGIAFTIRGSTRANTARDATRGSAR